MKHFIKIILILLISYTASAQTPSSEIVNALATGNAKNLAESFHSNLEIRILDDIQVTSRSQATRILQGFFKENKASAFTVSYEGDQKDSNYLVGKLTTKTGSFRVNINFLEGTKKKIIYFLSIEKI